MPKTKRPAPTTSKGLPESPSTPSALSASPGAHGTDQALQPTPGVVRKLAAMVYELLLVTAIVLFGGLIFDVLTQSRHALMYREARYLWFMLLLGIYFVWCWRLGGQTLAMKTWRLRLVDAQGGKPPTPKLILRYVLVWPLALLGGMAVIGVFLPDPRQALWWPAGIAGLALLWSWFDPERQMPHDRMLGLRLVHFDAKATQK